MDPQRRALALWYTRIRAGVGVGLLVCPGLGTRLAVGRASPASRALARMVGIRDVALGLGANSGIREGTYGPEWTGWAAVADGVDALALLVTPGLPKRARLTGIAAAAGAAIGMRLAWDLADERAARTGATTAGDGAGPAPE